MNILLAASECAPLVKVGGVADVIGSLPIALNQLGVNSHVVIPFYKPLVKFLEENPQYPLKKAAEQVVTFDSKETITEVYETNLQGSDVVVYLLKNEDYLSYGGVYFSHEKMSSPADELHRFAYFSKAIAAIFTYPDSIFVPDVIHCHDWHTGMVPQLIQSIHQYNTSSTPKTVFTIHNLGYQGFGKLDVADKLGININTDQSLRWDAQDDNLDFVLQGIVGSVIITTVSEKYAKEIQTEAFGEGLHDILKAREGRLYGVLNGISYDVFNPLADNYIYNRYSVANWQQAKPLNKELLRKELGLKGDNRKPLLGIVSRLAQQKGLDLVANSINEITQMGYEVVLLGTGDPQLEAKLQDLQSDSFVPLIKFSEEFARKIYAASDAFLIPSRYEPSGLTQMIAMKYGAIPVVRATGGLYDTVQEGYSGFLFEEFTVDAMLEALQRAYNVYSNESEEWMTLTDNAMRKDFSWTESAKKYVRLYSASLELR